MSSLKQSCPGSREIREPFPQEILCPHCGAQVEIWSDEVETECHSCHKIVRREMSPTCIQWCPAARECVGDRKYEELIRALKERENQ